ncbi:putative ribonuclease H-like domain-containing protein [Tanacetum coccineum]
MLHTRIQNEVLNKQRYVSDKSCIGFGIESSNSMESDISSGDETLTDSDYEIFKRNRPIKAVPPPTAIDRNKVIIEDWVDSDDEETDVSESQKETAFNSEKSETSFENRVNHSNFARNLGTLTKEPFIPSAVLTRDGLISTARPKMTQTVPSKSTANVTYQVDSTEVRQRTRQVVLILKSSQCYVPLNDSKVEESSGKGPIKTYANFEKLANTDYNNLDPTIDVPSTPHLEVHKNSSPKVKLLAKVQLGFKQAKAQTELQININIAKVLSSLSQMKSWVEAMQEELLQFKLQEVWVLCDLPEGKRVIGTKWVFRNKRDERGTIIKNKARLVAQGYRQEEGVDYDEVFAPVARKKQSRLFLAFCIFSWLYCLSDGCQKCIFLYGQHHRRGIFQTAPGLKDTTAHPNKILAKEFTDDSMGELTFLLRASSQQSNGAFSDSDYAGDNHDRRSTSGGCQYLGRRLVSWQCKKQTIVAIHPSPLQSNNESTICIVKNPVFHSKTKHIQIRHHFIRDCYEQRLIKVVKVHTDDNVADLLTKGFDLGKIGFLKPSSYNLRGRIRMIIKQQSSEPNHFDDENGVDCFPNKLIGTCSEIFATRNSHKHRQREEEQSTIPNLGPAKILQGMLNGHSNSKCCTFSKCCSCLKVQLMSHERAIRTRVVDFEKNAQDRESLEGISMITELQVIDSPDGEYLIIHRENNHFRAFDTLWEILHVLDRQDLYHLYRVVEDYYEHIPPTGLGLMLLGDLNIIWETAESSDDDFWKGSRRMEIKRMEVS